MEGERPDAVGRDDLLFRQLYPSLRRLAAVVRPIGVDPDDLVQEALTRTLSLGALTDRNDPGAYLRTAIVRLASNDRRSIRRRYRAVARLDRRDSGESEYPSDLDDLRRLSPSDQAILYLSVVEGRSHDDIAAIVGKSAAAVRQRASRALKRLRVELESEREEIGDA
jgi:DNA-directed RNA polymerase specialized sigma24 family protein